MLSGRGVDFLNLRQTTYFLLFFPPKKRLIFIEAI
jgi:hypothetical protein